MTLGILYSDGKFFSDACGGLGRRILPYFILYVCRDYIYRYIYLSSINHGRAQSIYSSVAKV